MGNALKAFLSDTWLSRVFSYPGEEAGFSSFATIPLCLLTHMCSTLTSTWCLQLLLGFWMMGLPADMILGCLKILRTSPCRVLPGSLPNCCVGKRSGNKKGPARCGAFYHGIPNRWVFVAAFLFLGGGCRAINVGIEHIWLTSNIHSLWKPITQFYSPCPGNHCKADNGTSSFINSNLPQIPNIWQNGTALFLIWLPTNAPSFSQSSFFFSNIFEHKITWSPTLFVQKQKSCFYCPTNVNVSL